LAFKRDGDDASKRPGDHHPAPRSAARYARMTRLWLAARNAHRRLHAAPVKNFSALRDAASGSTSSTGDARRCSAI